MPQIRSRWRDAGMQLALAGFALLFTRGDAAASSFAIVSQSPVLELRFHGVMLHGAHTDAQQSQIALDFDGPVDSALFDRLQQAAPGWIDAAYGSYDAAIIHVRHPVQFLTRPESDGFSLRFVTAQNDEHGTPDGLQKIEMPFDTGGAQHGSVFDGIANFFKRVF